jgi:protein-arginine kinase activator protein McsA
MDTPQSQIDFILNGIDWSSVNKVLASLRGTSFKETDLIFEKEQTRKRISFMLESELCEMTCKNWYFKREQIPTTDRLSQFALKVYFSPLQNNYRVNKALYSAAKIDNISDPECKTLHDLLYRSVENENYEMAAIIKARLEEIIASQGSSAD